MAGLGQQPGLGWHVGHVGRKLSKMPSVARPRFPAVINKREEAPQTPFSGSAETEATIAATRRKRILQQLLALHGRQDREQQQQELRQALCGDPQVEWAAWGMLPLDRARLEIWSSGLKKCKRNCGRRLAIPGRPLGGPGCKEKPRAPCETCISVSKMDRPALFSWGCGRIPKGMSLPGRQPCCTPARRPGGRYGDQRNKEPPELPALPCTRRSPSSRSRGGALLTWLGRAPRGRRQEEMVGR